MHCPHCDARLVRRLDLQCFVVGSFPMLLFLAVVLVGIPLVWQTVLAVVIVTVTWYVDAITVRLVEAGKWRGILGYDA